MLRPLRFLVPLLILPGLLAAQEVPVAEPGTIVTVTIEPPSHLAAARDSLGRLSLAYATETSGGIRLIGRSAGSFTWEAGEEPRFPVTLKLSDRAEAGVTEAALVAFESAEGLVASVPVLVLVQAIRAVDVQLVATREAAARGETVTFRYVLNNQGNAGDSVSLTLETNLGERPGVIPESVWLAPFQEKVGEFDLSVPGEVAIGSQVYVRLSLRLAEAAVSDNATVAVLPERGLFPEFVHIPSTLFLGSTVTSADRGPETQPVAAISGSGTLARDTELLFNFRHMPRGGSVYAFRGLLSGPRLFLGVQRPRWGAALGDLNIRTSDLLGFQLQGRGAQANWSAGHLTLQGMAARPTGLDGVTLDGHVAAAEVGFGRPALRGGAIVTSTERSDPLGSPESSVRAALGRVQVTRGGHWLGVDAGPMRVSNLRTSETEAGPSVDARYVYREQRADLDFRFRRLPSLLADPRLPPDELRAVATVRPTRQVSVFGTLYNEAVPQSLQFEGTRARGARLGLRWGEAGWAVGLTGSARRVEGAVQETRHLGRLDATLRAGEFTFDGSLGLGTTRIGLETELAELYRIGGSWVADRGMATFHVTVSDDILQPASTLLDAYGLYRLNQVIELYGSATTFVVLESEGFAPVSISDGLTVQTGARFRLSANRFLYTGLERFSAGGSDGARWRVSVGIQQGLPLPLPVRRPAAASGFVFEDLNGNGLREENEPGLDGVMLRMDFERTVTAADGRFEFRDAEPRSIEVDPRSLGDSFVPVPPVRVATRGETAIGLYRPGSLYVSVFLDADGDGIWDADELPASDVSLSVSRNGEPWVLRTGADGAISLSSLAPGTYVIQADPETLPSRALPAEVRSAEVRGSESTEVLIPVPMRQINFRKFGSDD